RICRSASRSTAARTFGGGELVSASVHSLSTSANSLLYRSATCLSDAGGESEENNALTTALTRFVESPPLAKLTQVSRAREAKFVSTSPAKANHGAKIGFGVSL